MKIWIKYLTGIIIGLAFALVIPEENAFFRELTAYLSELAINAGRYTLYPVLFFGFTIAVFELREHKTLFRTGAAVAGLISITTILLAVTAILAVLVQNPARIPIFVEGNLSIESINVRETIRQFVPSNGFEVFTNGLFILPLCIFAGFAGAGFTVDKNESKPALTLFDSLSRVSYAVMTFFVDIIAIGMIALSIHWTVSFGSLLAGKVFRDFIFLLFFLLFFVALVLYPLLIRLLCDKANPWRVMYASIAPVFAAFFSGDSLMTLPVIIRHSNESLGVRRKISSVTLPLFSVFARGGSAMVIIVSFVVILKSYSSLGIAFSDMVWLTGTAVLLSFFLGRFPSGGAFIALAATCALYGRGFESGYLILKPAAFFIGSIASAIDALTAITGTYIIAKRREMATHRELRFFI